MKFKNLFKIEYESDDFRLIRKLNLINFFFIIEILIFTVFTFINFFKLNDFTVAVFDLISAIIFLAAFLDLRFNKSFNRSKWITTIS